MDTVKDLLKSKKFLAMLAALIVWLAGVLGADLQTAQVLPALGTIASYIVGQGLADHGKERIKEAAKADAALNSSKKKASAKKR